MKKALVILLAVALVLGTMTVSVFALDHVDGDTTKVARNTTDFDLSFDTFYLDGVSHMDMGWGADGAANEKIEANPITGIHQNLTVRGWMGLKETDIAEIGYKINGGEPVFDESFKREAEGPVINAGGEMRMEVLVPLLQNEDPQLITVVAKSVDGDIYEAIEFSINGNYGSGVAPVETYGAKAILDNGGGAIGTWINAGNPSAAVKFTTAGAFNAINLGIYWASNPTVGNGPKAEWKCELFKFAYNMENTVAQTPLKVKEVVSDGDNNPAFAFDLGEDMPAGTYVVKFTLTNPEYTESLQAANEEAPSDKKPYLVLPKIDNPAAANFEYQNDAFNIVLNAEIVDGDFFVANPENTDVPTETIPKTGDAAVAMIAVIAVLAMGAAVVFAKKRSF
ncbi:MAG: LPXTG cell wall anchor domain-containing protein [Clostridia bacterium]|nr:LPXTG cell wall anchor domain-containing protein [Clostridia bacterium]